MGLAGLVSCAAGASVEEFSPRFSPDMPIFWRAPTNDLPARLWIYRTRPRIFSAAAISNGILPAGFEKKGFPRPTDKDVVIWADHVDGEPRPPNFAIFPQLGQMSYDLGDRAPGSPMESARDEAAVKRALEYAARLGVDPKELVQTNAGGAGAGGVSLPRQLDGIPFIEATEGFQLMLTKDGRIRYFGLLWPVLERERSEARATPKEVITRIRARKAMVAPFDEEKDYFARVRGLARAKSLTITGVKLYYNEGRYGEEPKQNEPPKHVTPVPELQATADFGTNRSGLRLYSPILSSDVKTVLEKRNRSAPRRSGSARLEFRVPSRSARVSMSAAARRSVFHVLVKPGEHFVEHLLD